MNPILKTIDALLDDQEQRHSWLLEAGEQIRRWKEEELAAVSGSSSLRSPEPVPVSAHTGNDPEPKGEEG